MIHQLIISTLLACQPKTEAEKIATPPKTPPKIIKTKPKHSSSGIVTFVDEPSAPKESKPKENFYSLAVQVSHITYPRDSYTDEQFCSYVCSNAFNSGFEELGTIQNCKLELIHDWETKRKNFDWKDMSEQGNPVVGTVECTGQIYYIQEGRAALSLTNISKNKDDLGGYFARSAQEEMTAVFAFQEMLQNLKSFGAPQKLLDDCEKAICDEKRHTIMMSNMAKRHGCESAVVKLPKQQKVSLFELAKHNAIAGCIDETWAALLAEHRAKHTKHYSKLFQIIATDEAFHAQLSWNIHQWLMLQLSKKEQQEIKIVMSQHLQKLPPQKIAGANLGEMTPEIFQKAWSILGLKLNNQLIQTAA